MGNQRDPEKERILAQAERRARRAPRRSEAAAARTELFSGMYGEPAASLTPITPLAETPIPFGIAPGDPGELEAARRRDDDIGEPPFGDFFDPADRVVDGFFDNVGRTIDTDHDGAMLDDVMRWGATGYYTVGGALVGTLAGPAGTAAGAAAGYGAGSVVGAGAEEFGDFLSDSMGTRGAAPYGSADCADLDYRDGRAPGLGSQLHDWLAG